MAGYGVIFNRLQYIRDLIKKWATDGGRSVVHGSSKSRVPPPAIDHYVYFYYGAMLLLLLLLFLILLMLLLLC